MAIHTSLIVSLGFLLVFTLASTNGLQCYICGAYNDGVGSITPCLNYSKENAPQHLKECPRKSDKFCVKYVSELSTVRDCVETCQEKDVWNTQTHCCNQDGCNDSTVASISKLLLFATAFIVLVRRV